MINPKFYIFGTPDGFDLFQGDADDKNYFQSFYDGSKESTKLSIHRKADGQVSYSYLKYRILSGAGRAGAFFGMSVVFSDMYCYDVEKIYMLFDTVYREIVLKNRILIKEIEGNNNVQAKFLVHSFGEQKNEVTNIRNVIIKNIENKFFNDIFALDFSFEKNKSSLVRKINSGKGNEIVLEALRQYSRVFISPEYKEDVVSVDVVPVDVVSKIPNGREKSSKSSSINKQANKNNKQANKKNIATSENHNNSNKKLIDAQKNNEPEQTILSETDNASANIGNKNEKPLKKSFAGDYYEYIKTAKRILSYFLTFVSGVCAVLLWQGLQGNDNSVDCSECEMRLNNFEAFLSSSDFEKAQNELGVLKDKKDNIFISAKQYELDSAAIDWFNQQARNSFECKSKKINCYNDVISKLNKGQKINSINLKSEIERIKQEYKSKTIAFYENEITNAIDLSKKQRYANIILLKLDGNNQKAMDILNSAISSSGKNEECYVVISKVSKSVSSWYNILNIEFNKKNFDYVIEGCKIIIATGDNCPSAIREKAQTLKTKAQEAQRKKTAMAAEAAPDTDRRKSSTSDTDNNAAQKRL